MSNYSKLFGALLGAIVSRYLLLWLGIDVQAMGLEADLNLFLAMLIDFGVTSAQAAIIGAFVYFFPANKPKAKEPEFQGENV